MWLCSLFLCSFFFFKQKTAYEMRISDWSSDVCSSDLGTPDVGGLRQQCAQAGSGGDRWRQPRRPRERRRSTARGGRTRAASRASDTDQWRSPRSLTHMENGRGWQFNVAEYGTMRRYSACWRGAVARRAFAPRSEGTSDLPSLMRTSYAVFCLKK